jgi:RNA polymerase sigma-70 factor (ECF subfamily)
MRIPNVPASWPTHCRWFDFAEVASAVGRSEVACRQLAVRARRHVDAGRPRFEADRQARDQLAGRFFDALKYGDVDGLRKLLAADVELAADGGGKAPALTRSLFGANKVAHALASVSLLGPIGIRLEPRQVNGQPGAIFFDRDHEVLFTLTLDIVEGHIQTIRSVNNPDKLTHLGAVANAWEALQAVHQARQSAP